MKTPRKEAVYEALNEKGNPLSLNDWSLARRCAHAALDLGKGFTPCSGDPYVGKEHSEDCVWIAARIHMILSQRNIDLLKESERG